MITAGRLGRLADLLRACDYTVDAVIAALGEPAHAALGRNQTVPGERALLGRGDPLATLVRLFLLQLEVEAVDVERALPGWRDELAANGVIQRDQDRVRAVTDLRPYAGDDGTDGWVFSDLTPGMDGSRPVPGPDYVLGVSPASVSLAQLTVRDPVRTALDLGTGCGVQSLHLARHARRVVATDVNTRALAMARMTWDINAATTEGAVLDLREGSLYAPVGDETFDLITTNPPFVLAPPGDPASRLSYREAGLPGDELMRRVVVDGARRLAPGGTLQVLGNWIHPLGGDWAERLTGWIAPTGCDAHVLERERLDLEHYVEIWLTDAGLAGTPGYRPAFRRWLDYLTRLGAAAVGMGWITLTRAGRDTPQITVEDWPYPVEQPIGPALGARRDAVDLAARLSEDQLLATRWRLAEDVIEESHARPGSAHPFSIVLRQQRGLRRVAPVDTALAGVLGACDGELTLAEVIGAVASIMEVEAGRLRSDILPSVRQFIVDGVVAP